MIPTKADFDNAVKNQHWNPRTCLVAQCMIRNNIPCDSPASVEDFAERHGLTDLMERFDRHFDNGGDEKTSPELLALREELPE